jgi:transcriptional regulator with XRE-family HTH domain
MTTARPEEGRLAAVTSAELIHIHELGLHRHLLVSERLRIRRRQLGLTQKEVVARLRRLGVDTTNKSLSSLEHGAGLDVCKLPELARALDCTLTYLVGLSADPLSWQPDEGAWPVPERVPEEARTASEPSSAPPETADRTEGPWILGPVPAFRSRTD